MNPDELTEFPALEQLARRLRRPIVIAVSTPGLDMRVLEALSRLPKLNPHMRIVSVDEAQALLKEPDMRHNRNTFYHELKPLARAIAQSAAAQPPRLSEAKDVPEIMRKRALKNARRAERAAKETKP